MEIQGIIPVMLTPFTTNNEVDYDGLRKLTDWYIDNGADTLFATCQSSEILYLSLEEKIKITQTVIDQTKGRIPVVTSGHTGATFDEQVAELQAMYDTGADAVILITNRLDPNNEGTAILKANFEKLLSALPKDITLGLYECPVPYRRLLTDEEITYFAGFNNIVVLKDVSCDLATVKRRLELTKNSKLKIVNANAAIAFDAMKAGSQGFSGVFNNIHPDLYAYLYKNKESQDPIIQELAHFLAICGAAESFGYPNFAKLMHVKIGTFKHYGSRVIPADIKEKYWAVEELLDHIMQGSDLYRRKIK
ncbi:MULTISPECIES: dihydrodipicolinate synthase family protein [Lonepinella]|uniref:4-hydroxy-tetrahydrodipicolinate synthase n=1 Tax=Lonepinella koalarum TaxID=53417 RepID=A0A4R1KXA9_9PAST|nr:dihydrodipicolinate synthase family protein [Lonepinella koalarum]MDH2927785.1 dihydrodipicolinate synthase family protein [Lonepinella koalarum]TCK69978.1 4-hydroxy-tetrahydrodipicolinate synthase [Lonepinella koalarum]TFJ90419.1 dihydrodipicolinate synthase family protein [Lonepinella koalarum]